MADITSNLLSHLACQDRAANANVANTGSVGGNQTLTGAGNTVASSVDGPGGAYPYALQLDGTDDWISLPNYSGTPGSNWSFAMWVKLDSHTPSSAQTSGWANLGPAAAGQASHYAWHGNAHHYCGLLRYTSSTVANRVVIYPSHPTPRTTWHHVAITTTPGADGWKLYVNGEVIGAATGQSSLFFNNVLWSIGRSYDGTNNYYLKGAVSDVRLYERTLSQEDIQAVIGLATGPVDEKGLRTIVASASAWRNYADTYGNLQLPPELVLTAPVTLPYVNGGIIEGLGHSEPNYQKSEYAGPSSNVIWAGSRAPSTTMLTYTGQRMVLRDCNLHGATREGIYGAEEAVPLVPLAKAPVILQLTNPSSSLGTGGMYCQRVWFSYADIGVKAGFNVLDHNCDEMTFDKCAFHKLGIAFQSINNQSLDWVFRECSVGSTPVFIDVKGGGHFRITDCFIGSPTTVLRFDPSSSQGYGPNGSGFYIDGLKIDNQAANTTIVNMVEHNSYYTDIWCDRIHFPAAAWTDPAFVISGKTTCQVTRAKNLLGDMFAWNNSGAQGTPKFVVENCRLLGVTNALDLFDKTVSSGDCYVKVVGCFDADNAPIADINTTLTGDL